MTVTDRFSGRRWRARLVRARPWLLALAALAALGALLWVLLDTPVLGAHDVRVDGVQTLDAASVRDVADIVAGTPLARLDVDGITERVGRIEQVESVEVRRSWPRSVVVTVVERTPVAVVVTSGDPRLLDGGGVVYPPIGSVPKRLPRVSLADAVRDRDTALGEVAEAVSAMDGALARQVEQVRVASRDGISLDLRDGAEVAWGSASQPELKAEVLAALLKQEASRYDVSAPGRPTIVP